MVNNKIKVLFAINCMNIGGAPSVVFNQLKYLDREKFDPHLLTLYPSKPANFFPQMAFLPKEKQKHVHLKRRSIFDLRTLAEVYRFLRSEKFDVVYTHLFLANFLVRSLAILARVPIIFSFEHSTYFNKSSWQILMDRMLAHFTKFIFVSTKEVAEFTSFQERIPREQFRVLRNPVSIPQREEVDVDELRSIANVAADDSPIFLTVGRFSEEKGQHVLLDAIAKIKEEIGSAKFLLVGHGPKEHELSDTVGHLALRDHVRIIHEPERAKEFLYIADWFVLPSLREGQAIVVEEAMLAGVPVIASQLEGMGNIINDKETGFVFPPGDSERLAELLQQAIKQMREREKYVEKVKIYAASTLAPKERVQDLEKVMLEAVTSVKI